MKHRNFGRLLLYLFILSACSVIISCQNDDDNYPVYDITGEWFYEEKGGDQTNFSTVEFQNGVYKQLIVWVGITDNTHLWTEGTYTYNRDIDIIYRTKYELRQYHEIWKINKADKYSLDYRIEGLTSEQHTFHKIVDTYKMSIGDSREISINDPDFHAVSYASCNGKVATIDEFGTIKAIKRGTTYIRVMSSVGEAVIRVEVTDSQNPMDDYSEFLGEPISKAAEAISDVYYELPASNGITFFLPKFYDSVVRELNLTYLIKDYVYRIDGSFQDDVDIASIVEPLNAKHTNTSGVEGCYNYWLNKNGHLIRLFIDAQLLSFVYELVPNAYEEYDKMITVNVDDFATWFNYDLSISEHEGYYATAIDNELFDWVYVFYDETTREIGGLLLSCRDGIKALDVEVWYAEHYIVHNHPNLGKVYTTNKSYLRSEYYITIGKDTTDSGKTFVQYFKKS
jgi:hypothetical protein